MNSIKPISLNLAIPSVIASVFLLLNIYQEYTSSYLLSIVPFLFYLLGSLALVISWHFNRTKFIFSVLPLQEKSILIFELFSLIYPIHLLIFQMILL